MNTQGHTCQAPQEQQSELAEEMEPVLIFTMPQPPGSGDENDDDGNVFRISGDLDDLSMDSLSHTGTNHGPEITNDERQYTGDCEDMGDGAAAAAEAAESIS